MNKSQIAIASIINAARDLALFTTGESQGAGSMGSFGTEGDTPEQALAMQDAFGNKLLPAKRADELRNEVLALTGDQLGIEYVVNKYVEMAIRGSKTRPSLYAALGVSHTVTADPTAETVAATYAPGATLTANVVPADREEVIAKAGNVLAGLYRGVTVFNAKAENNLTDAQKSANLDQSIPGTRTSYRAAGELARALGVKV